MFDYADESLNAGLDALIADINQSVKRGQQLGGIMDALFNGRQVNGRQASPARAASSSQPEIGVTCSVDRVTPGQDCEIATYPAATLCPACGRVKPDRCSLCSDYKREEQYYRTYDPNPSGE